MKMEIKKWRMIYRDFPELQCDAPCSLYSVLLENQLMEDPFYGMNEEKARDLCEYPCEFIGTFEVEAIQPYMELEFAGLDTICDIYLNGRKLDSVKNMHRTFTYDVANRVVIGTNTLRLHFDSPIAYCRDMERRHHVYTNNDCVEGAAQLRKALYMSGWDWGPQLPDIGIWKPITFRTYEVDMLKDFEVRQVHRDGKVQLRIWAESKHKQSECELFAVADGQRVQLVDGYAEIDILNPQLWWPNGYGEQNLYSVEVELVHNQTKIDSKKKQIGLRTLTVSREEDKYGEEFCFVVNGIKIFAMGANYIPQDNIISRVSKEKTEKLIQACVDANFNALRVWGGGYYPEEFFFDLCDQYGLIVWQDFMVACCNIYLREEFKNNIYQECEEQLKRIRHRACLGLVCGNNEMETAILNWGDDFGNLLVDGQLVRLDYLEFYERMLPELCYQLAPDTFYWPSSPSCGGEFDDPDNPNRGDQHFWQVWGFGKPFTEYRNYKFRFCSEFGFQGYPSMKTIQTIAEPEDCNIFSRVMDNHQKCMNGTQKMVGYIADNYLYPNSFEKLVYTSQILQADAIKYGVEYFRKNRGCCMGAIYWQLNDCWPVASWSSVDYYGRYKALHYAAKKFFAPLLCALFYDDHKIVINIANEARKSAKGIVKTYLCRSDFSVIETKDFTYDVEELSTTDIGVLSDKKVEDIYDNYLFAELYDEAGNLVMSQTLLFAPAKYVKWQKPEITAEITDCEGGVTITLSSNCFAKCVEVEFEKVDVVLSDNYVDITKEEPIQLFASTTYKAAELKKQLHLQSVYDIGAN